jgi:hypothetical protein
MGVQHILNRVQKQPGFVYGAARFVEIRQRPALEIALRPRKHRRARCSVCQKPAPGYDTLAPAGSSSCPCGGRWQLRFDVERGGRTDRLSTDIVLE